MEQRNCSQGNKHKLYGAQIVDFKPEKVARDSLALRVAKAMYATTLCHDAGIAACGRRGRNGEVVDVVGCQHAFTTTLRGTGVLDGFLWYV